MSLLNEAPQDILRASAGIVGGFVKYYVLPELKADRVSIAAVAVMGMWATARALQADFELMHDI